MSTDGDSSKGSGTEDGPDEFDSLVLDEDFIRGGVQEASLRRYQVVREQKWQRPASARPSGGGPMAGTASEAASANLDPDSSSAGSTPPAGDRDTGFGPAGRGPGTHVGTGERFSSGGFQNGRPRSTGLMLGAAALVVALVVLTGLIRLGRGSAGSTGTGTLPVAAQAGSGAAQTVVLSPSVPPGTCFNVPADSSATNMMISVVTCAARHSYELVDLQQGTGANGDYPAQATWNGKTLDQCSADLQTYTGETSASWPNGLYPAVIAPTQATWSTGNRTIYCIAGMQSGGTGSVRALGSGVTPTG